MGIRRFLTPEEPHHLPQANTDKTGKTHTTPADDADIMLEFFS